ncbi:MAG: efflux RND transporter periplasmic adaptor subunit [Sphingomonas sp.]
MISIRTLLISIALASLGACDSAPSHAPKTVRPADGPRLRLTPTATTDWKEMGGEITTTDQADARARIAGVLDRLLVHKGDMVTRGQPMGRIVDNQLGFQAAAFGAQAAAAGAQLRQAQADLARVDYLYRRGVYAKARLDQAEASVGTAAAQVRAARSQQSAVGAVAGQGLVLAPSTGRVLVADIPAGSAVTAGMSIATITSGSLIVRLNVPESLGGKIHAGSPVLIAGAGDGALRGEVSKVYPAIEAGQIRVDVAVPGIDGALIGRRVTARIGVGQRQAIVVPAGFVTTRFGIDYVTVLAADSQTSTVPVQARPADDGKVEILSGVGAGDTLIGPRR